MPTKWYRICHDKQYHINVAKLYIMARVKGLPAEPWKGLMEIIEVGKQAGWGLFLIIIILDGIYGGVFTPNEAAAVAAVYSFFIALFIYRDMGLMKDMP